VHIVDCKQAVGSSVADTRHWLGSLMQCCYRTYDLMNKDMARLADDPSFETLVCCNKNARELSPCYKERRGGICIPRYAVHSPRSC
jgi:hypothetical protein